MSLSSLVHGLVVQAVRPTVVAGQPYPLPSMMPVELPEQTANQNHSWLEQSEGILGFGLQHSHMLSNHSCPTVMHWEYQQWWIVNVTLSPTFCFLLSFILKTNLFSFIAALLHLSRCFFVCPTLPLSALFWPARCWLSLCRHHSECMETYDYSSSPCWQLSDYTA